MNSKQNLIARFLALSIVAILGGCSGATEDVSGPTGTISVYTTDNPLVYGPISVKIDGVVVGAVVSHLNTRPTTCNVSGAVNKPVAVGYHTLVAIDGIGPWSTVNLKVDDGGCYIYCYTNYSYGCL